MMKVLLDGGADATLALTNRTTPAILASGGNAPEPKVLEAVTLLVDHGVDVNAFNANGQTILHTPRSGATTRLLSTSQRKAPSSIDATSRVVPRSTSLAERAAADGVKAARRRLLS